MRANAERKLSARIWRTGATTVHVAPRSAVRRGRGLPLYVSSDIRHGAEEIVAPDCEYGGGEHRCRRG